MLRSIGDAVIACDPDGDVVFMNGVAEALTGWKQDEVIHRPLPEAFCIVDECTGETVESPVNKVRRLGTAVQLADHTMLIRRDGSLIPIDDSAAPVHDADGRLTGMVLVFRDISRTRRAERNLQLLSDSGMVLAESLDFQATLERIVELCLRDFADFCYFDMIRADGSIDRTTRRHRDARQQSILEEASRAAIDRNSYHPVNETLASGKPTLIEHVTDEWLQEVAIDEVHLRCMRELRFHTLLAVPVRAGNRNLGVLSFCRTVNRESFSEDDAEVTMELGRRIAAALVSAQLYQSTYEAEDQVVVEREKLRALFLQAPAPILMMSGPDLLVTLANDNYLRLLRRKSITDVVGKTIRQVLPELEGQGFFEILNTVYRTGAPYFGREMMASIDNTHTGELDEAFFNFVYQPTRDSTGVVDGILVFAVEITEQVRARKESEVREQLLQRQTSELETIYKTAPIGLALFDPVEFRYLRLNDTQAEIIGLPAAEVLGKTLTEIAPIDGLHEMFERVAEGNPVRNALLEGELATNPGDHRYWTVNYSPVYAENGSVQAISAASLEITGQKRAEQALIQNEKIAAVGRLASSIAHEINNPLEAVTNLLYLARQTQNPEDIGFYLETADRELRRISLITSQTLRFYRQSTRPQAIQARTLVDSVLTLNQGRLLNSGIAANVQIKTERPIVCFEGEIRQVLNNLVGNAVDAMPGGGRITIRGHESRNWKTGVPGMVLMFADTGGGISRNAQQRIFEPFFTTKGNSGTGLGLWISREIVEKHQGTLRVRSSQREGKSGTVFRLFLPFDAALPDSFQLPSSRISPT